MEIKFLTVTVSKATRERTRNVEIRQEHAMDSLQKQTTGRSQIR